MKDSYTTDTLVIGNLEYISSRVTPGGPMVVKTTQRYLFELLQEDGKIRYREIFTGFKGDSDDNKSNYFDLPYVVDIVPLKEQVPSVSDCVPKYGLLLLLDEVNSKQNEKQSNK